MNKNKIVKILISILAILIIIFIVNISIQPKYNIKDNLININDIEISKKDNIVSSLKNKYNNNDIVGTISIENNTDFYYPIVKSNDNKYYLNHNYYKEYDVYGAIYADYRINLDTSKKVLIFAHSDPYLNLPFNVLEKYEDKEYYNNHKNIIIETDNNKYIYQIFSAYIETKDFTYMNIKFDSKESWYSHIVKLKNKSIYSTDIDISQDDDILILQTCSNNYKYQNYDKKFMLVIAKKVK